MMNATWTVPTNPDRTGASPAFWWGIESNPALNLIQPILKWESNGWYIFNEYYQWSNGHDFQSAKHTVRPGNTIYASVIYVPANDSYDMFVTSKSDGWSIGSNIGVEKGKTYVDGYVVIEHQPSTCSQYPASGEITFTDIYIEIENKPFVPMWQAEKFRDACNCTPTVISTTSVRFTWDTT